MSLLVSDHGLFFSLSLDNMAENTSRSGSSAVRKVPFMEVNEEGKFGIAQHDRD